MLSLNDLKQRCLNATWVMDHRRLDADELRTAAADLTGILGQLEEFLGSVEGAKVPPTQAAAARTTLSALGAMAQLDHQELRGRSELARSRIEGTYHAVIALIDLVNQSRGALWPISGQEWNGFERRSGIDRRAREDRRAKRREVLDRRTGQERRSGWAA